MPPIDFRPKPKPKPKPKAAKPFVLTNPRGADTTTNVEPAASRIKPSRPKPKPAPPRPTTPNPRGLGGAFGGGSTERPFTAQQREAARKVDTARRRLPVPVVAAPPVIPNPTPAQVRAARGAVTRSVRQATAGLTGRERQAAQTELLREIATNPRLRRQAQSIAFYNQAQRALETTQDPRKRIAPGPAPLVVGVGPRSRAGFGPATLNLTTIGRTLAQATPGLQAGTAPASFVRNAWKDVGLIGTLPYIGAVGLGKLGINVAKDTLGGAAETETGSRTGDQLWKFGKQVVEGTKHNWSDPEKYLHEHPLLFGLDVAGAGSVVGRTAGATARAVGSQASEGGVRGALARAGSTSRPPIALTDEADGPIVERSYSKDAIRKSMQVGVDSLRDPVRDAQGNVKMVEQRGRQVPVLKATEHEIASHAKREADFAASRANNLERVVRDEASKEMRVRGIKGRNAQDLVSMVVEGTITSAAHFSDDLAREAARIEGKLAEHAQTGQVYRHTGEVKAAQARLNTVRQATSNPKVAAQAEKIVKTGEEIGRKLNTAEREALRLGLLHPKRAARARLSTSALAHLDVRHWSEAELRAAEQSGTPVRHPGRMARYETAQHAAREAAETERTVLGALDDLRQQQARTSGAQAVRRGQQAQQGPLRAYYVGNRRFATREQAAAYLESLDAPPELLAELGARRRTSPAPAVPKGYVRLYRGEGTHRNRDPEDWPDAPDSAGSSAGRWFTDKSERAEGYAGTNNGFVTYVDVPESIARAAHHSDTKNGRSYVLPDEWAARAGELQPGSIDRAVTAREVAHAGGKRAEELRRRRREAKRALGEPVRDLPPARPRPTIREVALTGDEAARMGEAARLDRAIKNRKAELRVARSKRKKAERTAKQTKKPPIREGLRGPDGRFVSNKDIENFLQGRGRDPETIAYLPHRLDVRGARAFHTQFRAGARPIMDSGPRRTGSAYLKGVTEASTNLIREHGVRQQTQINKAQQLDKMITDQGLKRPDGKYYTPKEALETAQRMFEDTGRRVTPVTAFGSKLSKETQRIIRDDLQGPGAMDSLAQRLLNDRVVTHGVKGDKGARNVVLVDTRYVERLNKHLEPASEGLKWMQMINRPFRFAVLSQFKWLTGQIVEPFLVRLTTEGSGINVFGLGLDVAASTRILRRMERSGDPRQVAAAKELRAQQLGGLSIGGRGLNVKRSSDELAMGRVVSKLPVIGQGYDLLRATGRALMMPGNAFFRVNYVIEQLANRGALGKSIRRDIHEFTGSYVKTLRLHKSALDEAAKGLINTATQRRHMRAQHQLLGKYEGYSPQLRKLIQGVLPFIPWVLNAARFVYWTMPAHHSALTAMLTNVGNVMAKDWEQIHSNVPPGGLKYALPTKNGGWIDIARYTPYGLTTPIVGSDFKNFEALTGQFMPAFSGARAAVFRGEDPFGRDLKLDPTENKGETEPDFPQRVGIGAYGVGEALTPYVAPTRRVLEKGRTGYAGSTLWDPDPKPGKSRVTGFERLLPWTPTYLGATGVNTQPTPQAPRTRREAMIARRRARQTGSGAARRNDRRAAMIARRNARRAAARTP